MSRITVDAGHNCYPDSGAVGILNENTLTRETVGLVKAKLENLGHQVFDVTPYGVNFNSVTGSLGYRVSKANSIGSDLHLCIHYNCGGGIGTECWISGTGGKSEEYANKIVSEISNLGYRNRGVKVGNLYVPRYTNMPCVLIEGFFIDSQEDCNRYNANNMADAIVKAITGQTSVVVNPSPQPSPSKPIITPPIKKGYSYSVNAKCINDSLFIRDINGNRISNRQVDIGDEICILDCSFSKQMLLVEYPTPNGIKTAYIKYVPSCLQLYYENQYHNGSTSETVYFDSSMSSKWGSLDPQEQTTPLFRKNGHLCVLYHSGDKIKNGFVSYDGNFNKF